MRLRRTQKRDSAQQARAEPTLADLLGLARERVAEIEVTARRSHEDLDRMADEMGAEAPAAGSPPAREQLAGELVASVTERIAGLHEEAAALVSLLERSTALLSPWDERPHVPAALDEEDEVILAHGPAEPEEDARETPLSEGVRLLATQMAVAGSSRSEIEDRLRTELNVRDPETLVDEVLGSARVP